MAPGGTEPALNPGQGVQHKSKEDLSYLLSAGRKLPGQYKTHPWFLHLKALWGDQEAGFRQPQEMPPAQSMLTGAAMGLLNTKK